MTRQKKHPKSRNLEVNERQRYPPDLRLKGCGIECEHTAEQVERVKNPRLRVRGKGRPAEAQRVPHREFTIVNAVVEEDLVRKVEVPGVGEQEDSDRPRLGKKIPKGGHIAESNGERNN